MAVKKPATHIRLPQRSEGVSGKLPVLPGASRGAVMPEAYAASKKPKPRKVEQHER
jgi:hypothetical protein